MSRSAVLAARERISTYTGAGTEDDPIHVHGDVDAAKMLLIQGKSIRMDSVMEVGTLVEELARVAHEAREKGEKAPNYDLCKVSVPGTNLFCGSNLGIPRVDMPQLKGRLKDGTTANVQEDWRQVLAEDGISITRKVVPASNLKASQHELVGPAVALMVQDMLSGAFPEEAANAPIFVTRDGYVLDGHHRWAAKVCIDTEDGVLGDVPMTVDMIDLDIGEAIDRARAYAKERGIVPKREVFIKPLAKQEVMATLTGLLEEFLIIERKLRHVRDAEYWGAPVGTPLPLPKPHSDSVTDFTDDDVVRTINLAPPMTYDPKTIKPVNLDPGVETQKGMDEGKEWQDWKDLTLVGEEYEDGRLEMAASLAFQRIDKDKQGKVFTKAGDVDAYVTEVLERAGYHDRLVSIHANKGLLGKDVEAGVTRGMTEQLPEDDTWHNAEVPCLIFRPKGVSEFVLLHEIAHIIEGSWKTPHHGGHNWTWWDTFGALLAQHGDLDGARTMLQIFGAPFDTAGVLK